MVFDIFIREHGGKSGDMGETEIYSTYRHWQAKAVRKGRGEFRSLHG
jgi:hypothetical protein